MARVAVTVAARFWHGSGAGLVGKPVALEVHRDVHHTQDTIARFGSHRDFSNAANGILGDFWGISYRGPRCAAAPVAGTHLGTPLGFNAMEGGTGAGRTAESFCTADL